MANPPGAPTVPNGSQPPDAPPLQSDDTASLSPNPNAPQWGLYKGGSPVIVADSVVTFGFKANSEISTYQVEQGAFQSYDKVQLPANGTVRYSTGGALSDRTAFLASIETAKQSTDLYDLVTPEVTYPNANVTDYNYDRTNTNGVGLLVVDVMVEEVRPTGMATYSTTPGVTPVTNAKAPGANDPVNDGTVQSSAASQPQTTSIEQSVASGTF